MELVQICIQDHAGKSTVVVKTGTTLHLNVGDGSGTHMLYIIHKETHAALLVKGYHKNMCFVAVLVIGIKRLFAADKASPATFRT